MTNLTLTTFLADPSFPKVEYKHKTGFYIRRRKQRNRPQMVLPEISMEGDYLERCAAKNGGRKQGNIRFLQQYVISEL